MYEIDRLEIPETQGQTGGKSPKYETNEMGHPQS